MATATQTKFVIVTPGRVAFTSPAAKEKFSLRPKQVIWNSYYQELLTEGDIQIVDPAAQMKLVQKPEVAAAMAAASGVRRPVPPIAHPQPQPIGK